MGFHGPHDHSHCTSDLLGRAEKLCAAKKLKLTGQRRDVLEAVAENHTAVGAYDIIERLARRGERPAPITVYRALDFLLAAGLVHKVESRSAYVACARAHAHDGTGAGAAILVCERCASVAELDAPEAAAALLNKARAQDFAPERLVIEISGRCRTCGKD